jgi:hypothetical protein
MQMAGFVYEPGMYEIVGPRDCDLPITTVVRDGYSSPSILGYKIRATHYPWLVSNPIVTAHLYEGTVFWLAPEYCTPTLLSTGEARLWICFGSPTDEQHWGWITCDPFAVVPGKSEQWIRKLADVVLTMPPEEGLTTDCPLTTSEESGTMTKQSTQRHSDQDPTTAEDTAPAAEDIRKSSSPFSRAMSKVAVSRDTKQKNQGYKETGTYHECKATYDPPARRSTLSSPMTTPMIAEMERINALNLEPSLPKVELPWPNDWRQERHTNAAVKGDRKAEFLHSLEVINRSTVQPAGTGRQQRRRQQPLQEAQAPGSSSDRAAKDLTGSGSEKYKWQ